MEFNFFVDNKSDTFNILVLGDSVSANYPEMLLQGIQSNFVDKKFKMVKEILPSARIIEIQSTIKSLLKKHNPQLVISMLGKSELNGNSSQYKNQASSPTYLDNILILKVTKSFLNQAMLEIQKLTTKNNIQEDGSSSYSEIKDPIGKGLLEEKRFNEALSYYNDKLSNDKSSYDLLSIVSELQIKTRKYKEASSSLIKLIERDPSDAPSYNALSFCFEKLGDYSKAKFWGNKGHTLFPKSPSNLKRLIELNQTFGNYKQYLKFNNLLDKIKGQKSFSSFYNGKYFYTIKNYTKALEYFKKSLKDHPNKSLIYLHLGHSHLSLGHKDETLKYYKLSLENDLFDENKHFNFLIRAVEYNRLDLAEEFYINYLAKKFPNEERFFIPIARTYLELKNYSQSYQYLEKYLNKYPTNSYANKTLAILNKQTKNDSTFTFKRKNIKGASSQIRMTKDYLEGYPKIAQEIINHNSKLIILQYPDMPFSVLANVGFPESKNIFLVDNLKLFQMSLESNQDIMSFFVWDAIHLSDLGDNTLVENLLKLITKNKIIE
jgi:tetratricopeptide (TPR) repeat protein